MEAPDYRSMCEDLIAAFDEIAQSYLPPSEYLHEYDRQACSIVETVRLTLSAHPQPKLEKTQWISEKY